MTPRLPLMALLVLLAGACAPDRIQETPLGFSVSPETVSFGRVTAGTTRTRRVELSNTGRSSGVFTVEVVGAGFTSEMMRAPLEIPAGGRTALEVQLIPAEAGAQRGALIAEQGARRLEVPLEGEGVLPQACPTQNPCETATFDPDLGCVFVAAADGAACATPCLEDGQCATGQCVGRARDCDDGDLCTEDSCDASAGCRHDARSCDDPLDPCQAAACDPDLGCTTSDVADGTSCGQTDCITARVCLAGTCTSVPAVDGLECSPATLCQSAGRCAAGACTQPEPLAPVPEWTYAPAPGRSLWTPSAPAFDAQGNIYFSEYTDDGSAPAELVSFTASGFERFRSPLSSGGMRLAIHPDVPQLLAYSDVVRSYALNGQVLWSVAASDLAKGSHAYAFSVVALSNPARWAVLVNTGASNHTGTIAVLAATDGAVMWSRSWDGDLLPLASGDGAQLTMGGAPCWGQLRPTQTVDGTSGATLATGSAGQLVAWTQDLVVSRESAGVRMVDASGSEVARAARLPQHHRAARISPTHVWHVWFEAGADTVLEIDSRSDWSHVEVPLESEYGLSLVLTDRTSALLLSSGATQSLQELRADGTSSFQCPLAGPKLHAAYLGEDRIFGFGARTLRAWKAPGLRPGTDGFTEPDGNPSRSGRPR